MKTETSLFVLLLTACTPYAPPAPDIPQAELILKSNLQDDEGTAKDWSRVENFFVAYADSGCEQVLGVLAGFRGFGSLRGPQERVSVAAGKRVYILVNSKTATHAQVGQQQTVRSCHNFVSYIPEDGHVYEMHQVDRGPRTQERCLTTLRDVSRGQQPGSFAEHQIEGRCAQTIGR